MGLKTDAIVNGVGIAGIALAAYYAKNKVEEFIPNVVKEGVGAVWVLGGHAFDVVTDPLDAFGILPGTGLQNVPKWQPTTPWTNTTPDPVSNNDLGFNFNLF